jgi:hypothetical protein
MDINTGNKLIAGYKKRHFYDDKYGFHCMAYSQYGAWNIIRKLCLKLGHTPPTMGRVKEKNIQ